MPHTGKLTSCQARAARAMLYWSIDQLATKSGISESTIRRIESGFGVPQGVTLDMLEKMKAYFEGRGFKFLWDDHDGPGVQWRKMPGRRIGDRRRASGGFGSGPTVNKS